MDLITIFLSCLYSILGVETLLLRICCSAETDVLLQKEWEIEGKAAIRVGLERSLSQFPFF